MHRLSYIHTCRTQVPGYGALASKFHITVNLCLFPINFFLKLQYNSINLLYSLPLINKVPRFHEIRYDALEIHWITLNFALHFSLKSERKTNFWVNKFQLSCSLTHSLVPSFALLMSAWHRVSLFSSQAGLRFMAVPLTPPKVWDDRSELLCLDVNESLCKITKGNTACTCGTLLADFSL